MGLARDVIVLGAGPAGLGAALAAARAGASVVLAEAGPEVGGLCRTLRHEDGIAYDIGGHIPFVRSSQRLRWLRELLGDDLRWVPRPVRSVRDGVIRSGRYLDQGEAADRDGQPLEDDGSALGDLSERVGRATVEREMRAYLEKIDGVALERIPAERARKLLETQSAPDGFHFPAHGIGQLMDAMAAAAREAGAEVLTETRAVEVRAPQGRMASALLEGPEGPLEVIAPRCVVALPAGMAARLFRPGPPSGALPPVRMRAVAIAYLRVDPRPAFTDCWVQVDDPAVPFARCFAPQNWSAEMVPAESGVFGCECYCQADDDDDPLWRLDDDELADRCARALVGTLGWVDPRATIGTLEVVRLPRAYPLPDRGQITAVGAPARWLSALEGVHQAPGAAVIEAIENGEAAAHAALGDAAVRAA